ncbi:MAG TPA: chromosome segregation protein, partial [Planctomycetaceae bacterium]|nr:chromosome segregation protein [Planctomycetaceae bacterium]
ERVLSAPQAGDAPRLKQAFLLTISRPPTVAESTILLANLKHQRSAFMRAPQAAAKLAATGDTPRRPGLDDCEVATWTTLSSLLLNLDEAISRE